MHDFHGNVVMEVPLLFPWPRDQDSLIPHTVGMTLHRLGISTSLANIAGPDRQLLVRMSQSRVRPPTGDDGQSEILKFPVGIIIGRP